MISYQIIQTSIEELKAITKVDFCVVDLEGIVVASTVEEPGISMDIIRAFAKSPADSQAVLGSHLFKILDSSDPFYILISRGADDNAFMLGKVAVSQIQNLMIAYKEKYDRNNFYQNLLLDNLLLVDIYNRAKKLRIPTELRRGVFIIESVNEQDNEAAEVIKSIFSEQANDFVTAVDERNIILIKALEIYEDYEQLEDMARMLVDMMNTEVMTAVRVSYGTIVSEIKDISKSYKEAKMALDVGKIFYAEKSIIAYNMLGIGRLIYQLPLNLCEIFIQEIFGDEVPEELDDEILMTVNKFFENNLNVSETSRQLYVHRNTLVYRIEKLQKSTGLDIRVFEDALTLKIALMVVSYMKYIESLS